jgi:protein disulfide-isomerase
MSRKFLLILFCFCASLVMQSAFVFSALQGYATSTHWLTNFDEAVKQARATSKPLVILFTGSDWCTWCNKLEQEVLDSPEFANVAGNKFVFLKLDFPRRSFQDPQLKAMNNSLQQKFQVRSFPTVILFDPQRNQQVGTTGYRPGGGRQYADFLIRMYSDYINNRQ